MGFMEWWGESVDPGKIGEIDLSGEHEACRCKPLIVARFLAVAIGLPVLWGFAIRHVPLSMWQSVAIVVGGTLIYAALAYLVNPQPDLENLGPCAGMVDHPWRYSDDVNRTILFFQCLLGPGRFIAESVLDVAVLFENEETADAPDEESQGVELQSSDYFRKRDR